MPSNNNTYTEPVRLGNESGFIITSDMYCPANRIYILDGNKVIVPYGMDEVFVRAQLKGMFPTIPKLKQILNKVSLP